MTDDDQQLHAIVHGIVQGVNFLYYTRFTAESLGVRGWVRNLEDGTVEVLAEGTRAQLNQLLDFLNRGPAAARVTAVDVEWRPATGQFSDFRIR